MSTSDNCECNGRGCPYCDLSRVIFPDDAAAPHHAADTDDATLKTRAVRDIREAMHPAGIISHEPPFTRPAEPGDAPIAGALIEGAFPWIDPETIGFDPEIAKTIERAAHPLQTLLGGPHVATLPDGSRVNLPAGTVLREGEDPRPLAAPPEPSARVALVLLMARILRESFAEGRTVKETVGDITEDMNAAIDLAFPELARHLAPSPK